MGRGRGLSNPVYIIVGSPGSGKSWVMNQLKARFHVIEQDDFINKRPKYNLALITAAESQTVKNPILTNTPFGVSDLMAFLEQNGVQARPVFLVEPEQVLRDRYRARSGKEIPVGHVTRQLTYRDRAEELGAFIGTSTQVLAHLKGVVS